MVMFHSHYLNFHIGYVFFQSPALDDPSSVATLRWHRLEWLEPSIYCMFVGF